MEETMGVVLRILFLLIVAMSLIVLIYLLRNVMYEKLSAIKDIFLNIFKFS